MALRISSFPWVADGVGPWESSAISVFNTLALENYDFANDVLDLWWVPGDMPIVQASAIQSIGGLARANLSLARVAIAQPFMAPPFRQRDQYALNALQWLAWDPPGATTGSDRHRLLSGQDWFNDGIDDLEAALMYVLGAARPESALALADTHYIASQPVDLPLAGDIELVVIRHSPFPSVDYTFEALERGVRMIEAFTGEPFPTTDVILLLTEPGIWDAGAGRTFGGVAGGREGSYFDAFILLNDWPSGPEESAIYHELAHHYYLNGPNWLSEGMANFLEAYALAHVNDPVPHTALQQRLSSLDATGCGRDDIQQHIDDYGGENCDYNLGERFFLASYLALGQQPVAAAIRDLHAQSMRTIYLDEQTIFHAFQSNTAPEMTEAFSSIYRRYHGGPFADIFPADVPDLQPLIALYDSANGDGWKDNGNWTTTAPPGAWFGVATESRGRVRVLELSENRLSGSIPPELGDLSDLRTLQLQVNSLSGHIPPALGSLSALVYLNLSGNELTGEIPSELAGLSTLGALHLTSNYLTGSIPRELATVPGLVQLALGHNRLNGQIPAELSQLTHLELLALNGNQLSGIIPPELGNLRSLRTLDLASNQLTGEIPPALAQLPNLEFISLSGNPLTGCIPLALTSVRINDLDDLDLPRCSQ